MKAVLFPTEAAGSRGGGAIVSICVYGTSNRFFDL